MSHYIPLDKSMVKTQIKIKELYQSQRKGLTQPVSFALMATALSSCGDGGGGSGQLLKM